MTGAPQGKAENKGARAGGDAAADEICEPCPGTCKIEVGAFRVVGTEVTVRGRRVSAQAAHLFILYTLSDGTQRFYRGGPTNGNALSGAEGIQEFNTGNSEPSGEFGTEVTTHEDAWVSPLGPIITHWGPWPGSYEKQAYEDGPAGMITLVEGPRYCGYHTHFVKLLQEIGALGIRYGTANSNSVVYTVLRRSHLLTRKPAVWTPGWETDLLSGQPAEQAASPQTRGSRR